jgi:spore germination cell wall hydrolase CwlJ-like protein
MLNAALLCLALNIYYEANTEPLEGKYAVALVTLNRVNSEIYPNKVCTVVYQPYQFSWTLEQKPAPSGPGWLEAKRVAKVVLKGWVPDITDGATHYHNDTVKPKWSHKLKKIKTIGKHTFYKKKALKKQV